MQYPARLIITAVFILMSAVCMESHAEILNSTTASDIIIIKPGKESYSIGMNMDILEDKTGMLRFEDVRTPEYGSLFKHSGKDVPYFGFSGSVFWLRFRIAFPEDAAGSRWAIRYGWPFISSLEAYVLLNGTLSKTAIDPFNSKQKREISFRLPVIKLAGQPGKTATVYLRVRNLGINIIDLKLLSENKILREISYENVILGAFFGIMFIMIIYHLLLYMALRDKNYIYLVIFLIIKYALHITDIGILQQFSVFGSETEFSLFYTAALALSISMLSLVYSQLLNLKKYAPSASRIFNIFNAAIITVFVFGYFIFSTKIIFNIFFIMMLLWMLGVLAVALLRLSQGYNIALYFIVIIILDIFSGFTNIFARLNIIPVGWFFEHVRMINSTMEIVIMSWAVSIQVRRMEKDRIAARDAAIENLKKSELIKDEFLANTSHELKTPLHGIVGLSELMLVSKKESLTPAVRENLSLISKSGRRLMTLVNDILDFSSIRHGNPVMVIKPVDLAGAVSYVLSLLSPVIAGKALLLRNKVPENFPRVLEDEDRLKQVLINLAGNSVKFTSEGVIEISAKNGVNGMAAISVSDTGPGINPDDMEKIFESFEQGDGSVSRSHEGTGLGLAISKKLVELQGGTIKAESGQGMGSVFTFTLQYAGNAATDAAVQERDTGTGKAGSESPEYAEESGRSKPAVLIADDDPLSLKILSEYLSELDYRVMSACDGNSALNIISKESPDIVLLDVMMPGISGYMVLKKIREKRTAEDLPVILITAKSQIDDIRIGFDYGANDYIIKPFNIGEISRRIDMILKEKKVFIRREPSLSVIEKGVNHITPHSDIVYLSSSGKKTVMHTARADEILTVQLKDLESRLPHTFVRIHKQYVINTAYLLKIVHIGSGRYEAILKDEDDTRLIISRTGIGLLRKFLGNAD